jgi:hypothetical protein
MRGRVLVEVETWPGRFDAFFQITACVSMGENGGGGWSFSKFHLEQYQPPMYTRDLKLETVNRFICKVEHWVCQGGAAMGTTQPDMRIDLAWRFMDSEVYSWFAHWICQ